MRTIKLNNIILFAFLLLGCAQNNDKAVDILVGEWYIPKTDSRVLIDNKFIQLFERDSSSYEYSFDMRNSLILISIPESDKAYLHDLELSILSMSINRDTIIFRDSYINAQHMAYKLVSK